MTALEYWEKQFPERMSKATDRERKLLAAQDPRNWTVHTERDLEDLIVLLKDFDTKCQQGKAMESLFFRREDRKMKELSDRNNTANASCQAIGAALLGVGISLEGEWWVTRAALAGLGVGIMLLGRTAWGIRKTQQAIWDNMCSRLGIKPTPEVMAA
ncbi:MAG: hypothetical protein IKX02_00380, partial [Spirochaetales bacterium]|nr:hypothetical protein [Spirochaetales bacterium]